MKRKEVVSLAAERACNALGFKPGKSRIHRTVQKRMAIAMAMNPYCDQYEIGEVLHRHRSCIYHYLKNHDNYMEHWDGYKEMYHIAQLEGQITKLVLARDEIKKQFEEATS